MLSALMQGCGVYQKYSKATEVDTNLFGDEYAGADTASIATVSWREFFKDPMLRKLIDSALVRNTDLRTAHLRTFRRSFVLPSFSGVDR